MEYYHVPGVSITFIDNRRITTTENFGRLEAEKSQNVNNNTTFNACSINKFLTGLLVMKLIDQGHLELD